MVVIRMKAKLVRMTGRKTIEERDLMRKRQALVFMFYGLTPVVEDKAQIEIVEFLRKTLWRRKLRQILRRFVPKIKKF